MIMLVGWGDRLDPPPPPPPPLTPSKPHWRIPVKDLQAVYREMGVPNIKPEALRLCMMRGLVGTLAIKASGKRLHAIGAKKVL